MNIHSGSVADPLISRSGKVFSLSGIRRLIAALEKNGVDDRRLCCRAENRMETDNGRKETTGNKREGRPAS